MAHNSDYTHIWSETSNALTIDEIARALGEVSNVINDLAVSQQIIKWIKYKPTRFPGSGYNADWWKGPDGCCGLDISYQEEDLSVLPTGGIIRFTPEWAYLRPRGSAHNEWFRILDFDGYEVRQVTEGQTPVGYFDNSSAIAFGEYDTPIFNVQINANQADTLILHAADISPKLSNIDLGALTGWYVGLHAQPQGEQGVFLKNYSGQERLLSYYQGVSQGRAQFYNPAGWSSASLKGKTWTFTPFLYKYMHDGNHALIGFGTPSKQASVFQYAQRVTGVYNSMSRSYNTSLFSYILSYNFIVENFTRNAASVPVKIIISGSWQNTDLFEDRNTDEITLETASLASLTTKTYNSYITNRFLADSYNYIAAMIAIYTSSGWDYISGEVWLKGQPPIQ